MSEKTNLLFVGTTGAGKSSFINLLIGKELAPIGADLPIHQKVVKYPLSKDIILHDFSGYEMDSDKEVFTSQILDYIDKNNKISEPIHLIFFCFALSSARIRDYDIKLIKMIIERGIPLTIILTKRESVSKEQSIKMQEELRKYFVHVEFIESCSSKNLKLLKKMRTIEKTYAWIFDNLDKEQQIAFTKVFKIANK